MVAERRVHDAAISSLKSCLLPAVYLNQNSPEQIMAKMDVHLSFAKHCRNRVGSQADCAVLKKRRSRAGCRCLLAKARRIGTAAGRER
jgi:hypothetical protein